VDRQAGVGEVAVFRDLTLLPRHGLDPEDEQAAGQATPHRDHLQIAHRAGDPFPGDALRVYIDA
jgi:hypothetical protein